jgi:ubiquinone biosynthesis protein Coq4
MFSRRKKSTFNYTMDDLEQLPEGTLGKDLVEYLKKMNFTLLKNYERHDCKHILFEYEMDELGEAGLQFYFLGNGKYSIPSITTALAYITLMPENWKYYQLQYIKGKKNEKQIDYNQFDYNKLILKQTSDIKKQFNIL